MLSKSQIAVLHVAKAKLGLDEETYRDMLEVYAGVRSAKDMDYEGFQAVMGHFERAGFKRQNSEFRSQKSESGRHGMATGPQLQKIRVMWLQLAGSYYVPGQEWRALRGFLRKRFRVEHENFLTFQAAHRVIEAIKAISHREHREHREKLNLP